MGKRISMKTIKSRLAGSVNGIGLIDISVPLGQGVKEVTAKIV